MSVVEVIVSLAMVMLNAAQVCATLATATADGGKWQLSAVGYLNCDCISPTLASVTEVVMSVEPCVDCHESDAGDQSGVICWCSMLSLRWSLLAGHRLR